MHLPTAAEVTTAAQRALGAHTDKHLAFLLWQRYALEADQPKVSRWRRGIRGPNFEAAIVLLHAAGWLDEAAISRDLLAAARDEAQAAEDQAAQTARSQAERQGRSPRKRKTA